MAEKTKEDNAKEDSGKLIYEDAIVSAVLQDRGAALGHIKVYPRKPYKLLRHMPDDEAKQLFITAMSCASAVFEHFSAQGTNIILNENGKDAVCIDVIPRKFDDGLNFQWQPKQLEQAVLENAFESLKDKAFYIGKKRPEMKLEPEKEGRKEKEEKAREMIKEDDEENYQLKHLVRIP